MFIGRVCLGLCIILLRSRADASFLNCENGNGCFGVPASCSKDKSCNALASFIQNEKDEELMDVSLFGDIADGKYVALGASEDDKMGEDLVFSCSSDYDGKPSVKAGFNKGRSSSPFLSTQPKFSNVSLTKEDGKNICSFQVPKKMEVEELNKEFDFGKTKYNVLVAVGPTSEGQVKKHTEKAASAEQILFSSPQGNLGGASHILIQLHGAIMIFAWLVIAYTGMEFPQLYKNSFKDTKICNVDVWFAFHRSFMVIAVLLTIAGFVLTAIYNEGWNFTTEELLASWLHPVFGLIVLILALIQPLVAYFRPHPEDEKRYLFTWFHRIVAFLLQICSLASMFTSVKTEKAALPQNLLWCFVVYFIITTILVLIEVLYLAGLAAAQKKSKNEKKEDRKTTMSILSGVIRNGLQSSEEDDDKQLGMKISITTIRFLLALGFAGFIIYLIAIRDPNFF